jgi:hypothetical protein
LDRPEELDLKEDQKLSESHHNATTLAIPFENQKERKKKKKKVIVCGKIKTYIKRQKKTLWEIPSPPSSLTSSGARFLLLLLLLLSRQFFPLNRWFLHPR